jgi:hypothetical protein
MSLWCILKSLSRVDLFEIIQHVLDFGFCILFGKPGGAYVTIFIVEVILGLGLRER